MEIIIKIAVIYYVIGLAWAFLTGTAQQAGPCTDASPRDCSNQQALQAICANPTSALFCRKSCHLCKSCTLEKFDLIFILDASPSVGKQKFEIEKEFVKNITNKLPFGPNGVQVGIEIFNENITTTFHLNQFSNKTDFLNALSKISFPNGTRTNIGVALQALLNDGFKSRNGDRLNAHDILVIVSDGISQNQNLMVAETTPLHNTGVTVFVVEAGLREVWTYRNLATDSRHFFSLYDTSQLRLITEKLADKICKVTDVLGSWTSWSAWSTCSGTCDKGGIHIRSRMCSKANSTFLHPCIGNPLEITKCTRPCPAHTYKGCYVDHNSSRVLNGSVVRTPYNTIEGCVDLCNKRHFRYAGLEYSSYCYCGNVLHTRKVNDNECNILCYGDRTEKCGASNRLSVYQLTSTPFG